MSKVVHLSEESHRRAKEFCKAHRLRMSDWVAILINEAVDRGRTDITVRAMVPKKKILKKLDETPKTDSTGVLVYAKPPFWQGSVT